MMNCGSSYTGPVAGADELDGVLRHLLDVLQHLGAEGHHDLGVVPLGAVVHLVLVGEDVAGGVVRAEEVAAEEDPVLREPGAHRLGPVDPGREEEGERLVAELRPRRRRRRSGTWRRRRAGGRSASPWPSRYRRW